MAKYTIATKIKAVQLYEAGNGSTTIAKMLGLPVKGTILRWVYLWQTKGLAGLTKSSLLPKYTIAFKLKVITWLRAHDASFPETAKQFSISHPATIWQWQHQYE
ncbi:helix-turn-helix domain-containing protein, partial [Leuconostoc inhae]